jgi:hypothetical protein
MGCRSQGHKMFIAYVCRLTSTWFFCRAYGTVKIFTTVMKLNLRIMNFVESIHFMVSYCIFFSHYSSDKNCIGTVINVTPVAEQPVLWSNRWSYFNEIVFGPSFSWRKLWFVIIFEMHFKTCDAGRMTWNVIKLARLLVSACHHTAQQCNKLSYSYTVTKSCDCYAY